MLHRIVQPGWEMIQKYARMKFGEIEVACPYYMYTILRGLSARVSIGKGFPEEIVEETNVLALVNKVDLTKMSAEGIRSFMVTKSIGIDCSGYIAHVLHAVHGKRFFRSLTDDSFGAIFLRFRPFQKINVHLLRKSGTAIDYRACEPEDVIVTRGGKHALLVIETKRDDNGTLKAIQYTHSTLYFKQNGVRFGSIEIVDQSKPLEQQRWIEGQAHMVESLQEENYTYQGYVEDVAKNGVYRLSIE